MPERRPTLLFHCQHSLGIGHLTRSFALAAALRAHFRVVFLNGGPLPPGLPVPAGIERIDLPPLGMDDGHTLVSRDGRADVEAVRAERRRLVLQAATSLRPAVLLVELFPFGRKKFAGEILPLVRTVRAQGGRVACSLRDILVDARPDQARHDERARWMADRWFDLVLVHADPAFARLSDSFHPRRALRVPVLHTGFVVPDRDAAPVAPRGPHVLVSAGGGSVGAALLMAALDAHARLADAPPLRLVAGPFLPEPAWQALRARAAGRPGVTLLRQVPDLVAELREARASISQCGYNTALDLVVAGVPALVVPYATAVENEQRQRAARLAAAGAVQVLDPDRLDAAALATALQALLRFTPRPAALALDGAVRSARALAALAGPGLAALRQAPLQEVSSCTMA